MHPAPMPTTVRLPPAPEPSHAERCRTLLATAAARLAEHAGGRAAGLPVRLGGQLRARRARRPAAADQHDGRAHAERTARPTGQPARRRAGARRRRPTGQRPGDPDRRSRPGARRRAARGARTVRGGQPDGGVLRRLRRLRLLPPRRAGHPLHRRLRPDELGRRRRLRARRGRPAGRRHRRRDHRPHERRPRRVAGALLPPAARPDRHRQRVDVRRRPLRVRHGRRQPGAPPGGAPRLPRAVQRRPRRAPGDGRPRRRGPGPGRRRQLGPSAEGRLPKTTSQAPPAERRRPRTASSRLS